ncbi:MFS transporter [Thermorudis peleae]|uniref:MFS transporter n=1 Tax=Thermorudis peleae TaxID=1382356 RepID=UPI000570D491|nr:MFS transporter [Thermorudis peleae]
MIELHAPPTSTSTPGATRQQPLLRHRPFLLLWLVQTLSQTSQNMVNFSLLILVREILDRHQVVHVNTPVGLAVLSFALPALFFSPLAGVLADRLNRRTLLMVTNALRGLAALGFLIIDPQWPLAIALGALYLITFVSGAVGQFFGPALASALPDVAPHNQIVQANALFNLTFTVSQLVGFAAAGPVLIKLLGVEPVLVSIVALFSICAVLSYWIPAKPPAEPMTLRNTQAIARQVFTDLAESTRYILQTTEVRKALTYLSLATATYLMVAVLGPGYITLTLHLPSTDLAYLVVPAGLGVVLGTILVPRVTARLGAILTIDLALTLGGFLLIGLAVLGSVASGQQHPSATAIVIAAALAGLLGCVNGLILAPSQSLLQLAPPEHIRGRVYAAFFMVSNGLAFVPVFFSGALADLFGITRVLGVIGLGLGMIGGWQLAITIRALRHHRSQR